MVRLLLLVRAAQASHTRLRQLADFPSVRAARAFNLRYILGCASSPTFLRCEPHRLLSFAQPSLILR